MVSGSSGGDEHGVQPAGGAEAERRAGPGCFGEDDQRDSGEAREPADALCGGGWRAGAGDREGTEDRGAGGRPEWVGGGGATGKSEGGAEARVWRAVRSGARPAAEDEAAEAWGAGSHPAADDAPHRVGRLVGRSLQPGVRSLV